MKHLILLSLLFLSFNLIMAQSQKESLATATQKQSSWIGLEIGLMESPTIVPVPRTIWVQTTPIHPSLNYSYFIKNRLALFGALRTGVSLMKSRPADLSISSQSFTATHIGGSIGSRWYPFKPIGLFGEIEYQNLLFIVSGENFNSTDAFQSLGIDVGWTWFVGKQKNIILEVQGKTIATTFKNALPLDTSSPYSVSAGIKYNFSWNKGE